MNVPQLVGTAAIGAVAYEMLRANRATDLTKKSLRQNDGKTLLNCHESSCATMRKIQLDTPKNTANRDDRMGGPSLSGASQYVTTQFQREAHEDPGVALVAASVA